MVQFVDFTGKLISASHKFYVSESGTNENLELEGLAQNLQQLAEQNLQQLAEKATPPEEYQNEVHSKEKKLLRTLADQCIEISNKLLSLLLLEPLIG